MLFGEGTSYENLNMDINDLKEDGKMCQSNVLSLIKQMMASKTFFFSVELIPSTTLQLHESFQTLQQMSPLFATVMWDSKLLKISRDELSGQITEVHHPAFDVVQTLQNNFGVPAVMHFSVGLLTKAEVHAVLVAAHALGIRNIFALRGDIASENDQRDFPHASNLVEYIKREFGNAFTIAVAGYPMGHQEALSYKDDLQHLKEKINCGADFIITQMILSLEELDCFVKDCRKFEIQVPIIPGFYMIETKSSLHRMMLLCKLPLSHPVLSKMEEFCGSEDMERHFGFEEIMQITRWLLETRCCPGMHFFTLNR